MHQQINPPRVECQSGYSACDRPTAVVWEDQRLEITRIESERREPEAKCYRLITGNGLRFETRFYEIENRWQVMLI